MMHTLSQCMFAPFAPTSALHCSSHVSSAHSGRGWRPRHSLVTVGLIRWLIVPGTCQEVAHHNHNRHILSDLSLEAVCVQAWEGGLEHFLSSAPSDTAVNEVAEILSDTSNGGEVIMRTMNATSIPKHGPTLGMYPSFLVFDRDHRYNAPHLLVRLLQAPVMQAQASHSCGIPGSHPSFLICDPDHHHYALTCMSYSAGLGRTKSGSLYMEK